MSETPKRRFDPLGRGMIGPLLIVGLLFFSLLKFVAVSYFASR